MRTPLLSWDDTTWLKPENLQPALFSLEEREQLHSNTDALRRRLEEIPGELAREQAALKKRFANPQARLFPVAVTFLVPERLSQG